MQRELDFFPSIHLRGCCRPARFLALAAVSILAFGVRAEAQLPVSRLIVEVTTSDTRFAGTDDAIQLTIGGMSFPLDDPDRDDFERGNTDRFELEVRGGRMTVEGIRANGRLSVIKLEDSFWGGGWQFGGLKIWVNNDLGTPLYDNPDIDRSLDGDHLEWHATLDDPGWNFPEPPPPFPPCLVGDVDLGLFLDSDCDGIPDDEDDEFNPPDGDGDGLPDGFEDGLGTDPNNPDSDGDGWWDGGNRRSFLMLVRIEAVNGQELGRDEIFLAAEDTLYPLAQSLEGKWTLDEGSEIFPGVVVDVRVAPPAAAGFPVPAYKTRFRLRERDGITRDDHLATFTIDWNEEGTFEAEHNEGGVHYELTFESYTVAFRDPNPTDATGDTDADAIAELREFQISTQDPTAESNGQPGYMGLADPDWRDAFVEVDAVGSDEQVPIKAKEMVVSQFQFQGITMRMDAAEEGVSNTGYLGGGQVFVQREVISSGPSGTLRTDYQLNPSRFAPERRDYYRYGVFAAETQGPGSFGFAAFAPSQGGFAVGHFTVGGHTMLAQFAAITLMHELGHTFNLCHRVGDTSPTAPGSCPASVGARCARYCSISSTEFVDQTSTTAMGSDTLFDLIVELGLAPLIAAAGGVIVGAAIGSLFGPGGAVVGAIIGGLIGAFFAGSQADIFTRFVDFHPIEWQALRFWA